MPRHTLFLSVDYDVIKSKACFSTNIQKEKVADVIVNFLRTQIGAGEDTSEANILDLYEIDLLLDLSTDTFSVSSNCGNLGLRDGILHHLFTKLRIAEINPSTQQPSP